MLRTRFEGKLVANTILEKRSEETEKSFRSFKSGNKSDRSKKSRRSKTYDDDNKSTERKSEYNTRKRE